MSAYAWVDGAVVPREDARISIDDFAVRYGAACFETMLARSGRVFRLDAHLDRLEQGLGGMRVAAPPRDLLRDAVTRTLEANALTDASVRLTVTAGSGHVPSLSAASAPSIIVTADVLPASRPAPPRLRVVATRVDAQRALAGAKTAQFVPYLLARAEARGAGADDAALLNHDGALVEAATANLFLVRGDTIETPTLADGPLPGVTRDALIEVARGLGVSVVERTLRLADVVLAEAIVLTSSIAGLVPAATFTARQPEAPGNLDWHAREPAPALVALLADGYEALLRYELAGA